MSLVTEPPEKTVDPRAVQFITTPAAGRPQVLSPRLLLALAFGLTLLTYAQVWRFDFVYDDHPQIVNNPKIQDWSYARGYFTSHLWANAGTFDRSSNYYRPLFLVWLRLNHALFGLNASRWHAVSLALHLLAIWLVYLAGLKLLALVGQEEGVRRTTAALAALTFGLHPVHVEPVAWISASSELLLTIFFLVAFTAYVNSRLHTGRRSWGWMAASLGFFALALLTKETAVMLVPFLLCCEILVRRGTNRGRNWSTRLAGAFAAILPWVAMALAYLVVRRLALGELGHTQVLLTNDVVLKTLPALLWFYTRHLLWPCPLAVLYDVFYVHSFYSREFLVPVVAMLLVAAALWALCRGKRAAQLAILWIGLTLLPVLDAALLRFNTLAQDRYLYLPSFGFCLILALLLVRLCPAQSFHKAGIGAVFALTVAMGAVAGRQVAPWENDLLLFRNAVAVSPLNAMAETNLATELMQRDENSAALRLLLSAYEHDAYAWNTSFNLGYLYFNTGNLPQAERFLQHAIQLDPHNRNQFLLLGLTQKRMGNFRDAAVTLRKTAKLWPQAPYVHLSLGEVFEQQGRYEDALGEFRQELDASGSAAARGAIARVERERAKAQPGR